MVRPISRRNVPPAEHPAYPTKQWWQESLFNRLSRRFMFRPAGAEALAHLVSSAFCEKNILLAQAAPRSALGPQQQELASELGCLGDDLDRLTGADMLSADDRQGRLELFCKTLRYCRACLELGYHSMVFQHWAVDRCHVHRTPLLDRCYDCGQPVVPVVSEMQRNPFCCPRCGRLFLRTVAPADAAEQVERNESEICTSRRDLEVDSNAHFRRARLDWLLPSAGPDPRGAARRLRNVRRVTAWPMQYTARWPLFKERQLHIDSPNTTPGKIVRPPDLTSMASEPSQALRWLRDTCVAYREDSLSLIANSWLRIQYLSPQYTQMRLSAVAAALHLTMVKYGVHPVNFYTLKHDPGRERPYHGVIWNGIHAPSTPECYGPVSGTLVGVEILAYFALCLRRCAGLHRASDGPQTSGHEEFTSCSYIPTWRVQQGRGTWYLRFRPRATEQLVAWLLRRYRDTPLRRTVVCMAPSRSRYGLVDAVELWSGSFPEVLLQFPRQVTGSETAARRNR